MSESHIVQTSACIGPPDQIYITKEAGQVCGHKLSVKCLPQYRFLRFPMGKWNHTACLVQTRLISYCGGSAIKAHLVITFPRIHGHDSAPFFTICMVHPFALWPLRDAKWQLPLRAHAALACYYAHEYSCCSMCASMCRHGKIIIYTYNYFTRSLSAPFFFLWLLSND